MEAMILSQQCQPSHIALLQTRRASLDHVERNLLLTTSYAPIIFFCFSWLFDQEFRHSTQVVYNTSDNASNIVLSLKFR